MGSKKLTSSRLTALVNLVCLFWSTLFFPPNSLAQGILIRPGAHWVVKGAPSVVMRNARLNNQGTFQAGSGMVIMSGHVDSTQAYIDGNVRLFNLQINKTAGTVAHIRGKVGVQSVLTVTNGILSCDSNLTLLSDENITARVASLSGSAAIRGIAHVERYIPARRAWRLMTAPQTASTTIFQSWQNGGVYTPGWGTLVTGPNPTGPSGNGLDPSTMNNISLRRWNHATQSFNNITNTHTPVSPGSSGSGDNAGYFIFVRGDRDPANTFVPNTNVTRLRTSGVLQTGNQTFTCANRRGQFTLVGNPYASPVNMNQVARTNLIKRIYVWDPRVNQVGAYVMIDDLDNDGTWTKSLLTSQMSEQIQSTQAFFVETQNNAAASIRFQENFKSATNNNEAFRPASAGSVISSGHAESSSSQTTDGTPALYTNLYLLGTNGNRELADGNVAEFNALFADTVDLDDAVKLTNQNETIGLLRRGVSLSAERRPPLQLTDTLFYALSRTSARAYQFEFIPMNFPAGPVQGFLEDRFLQTQTPVSLQQPTTVTFSVTNTVASAASNRFRMVFKPMQPLPVRFLRLSANPMRRDVEVAWDVEAEIQVAHYVVERSSDGRQFQAVAQVTAQGISSQRLTYNWLDVAPTPGTYFYRIQSVDRDGQTAYSNIVRVQLDGSAHPSISLFPNPVTQNQLNIQWQGMPEGQAQVVVYAANGQRVATQTIALSGANGNIVYRPQVVLPAGQYWLEWIVPNQTKIRESFLVQ